MKTGSILIVLISLLCSSCKNRPENTIENEARIADSLLNTLQEEYLSMLTACDSLKGDPAYKNLFSAFCPNDTIHMVPVSWHKKFPFDTLITQIKDTVIYSFKVSNECCINYVGRCRLNADTLILSYNFCGNACDCYCDYVLTYKIPTKKYPYKHVRLETAQLLPFNKN
jgi:hypothetical protein